MRICLVYDHLYPVTVGGGERWMHDLALALARDGNQVTYLTMRHWTDTAPSLPGVRVVGLVPAGAVYDDDRRTLGPPLRFGVAVGRYLLRHGNEFDVVHTAAFPYFPLLAAGLARRRHPYRLVADWYEVWTRSYWQSYAGKAVGTVGWLVQRRCTRVRHDAFCISHHTRARLLDEGFNGGARVLPGLYAGPVEPSPATTVEPLVVYAGRHVKEKRVPLLLQGFAQARRHHPELRLEIYGDGPDRATAEEQAARLGLTSAVTFFGRRPQEQIEGAFARATCVATASQREGYGLIVVEAAARGTPSVVVDGPENAAVELVAHGVNGVVAAEPSADAIGSAISTAVRDGPALRASTAAWFEEHAASLRIERSVDLVVRTYDGDSP